MASTHPYPDPTQDPNFYCHGRACMDGGCSPLWCKDTDQDDEGPWCPQHGYGCMGCEACC